jgi:hypothetical protein
MQRHIQDKTAWRCVHSFSLKLALFRTFSNTSLSIRFYIDVIVPEEGP